MFLVLPRFDTRWKFQEMYKFRDKMVEELGLELLAELHGQDPDLPVLLHG